MRLLLVAFLAIAAVQQAPRDAARTAPVTCTAIIKGRVVTADTGTPIRRALVTIGVQGGAPRRLYTDAEGRYEARNLPAGLYVVSASPNINQAQLLPAAPIPLNPDGTPRRVPLADGQTIEWYDITLPRAGAIVGRIVDEFGDPVSGVYVTALRPGEPPGRSGFPTQPSDEFGRYRIYRLPAGEYQVVARPSFNAPEFGLPPIGFVETFYPGTSTRDQSGRITVRPGQDTNASELQLLSARLLRVSGTVVSAGDGKNNAAITVMLRSAGGGAIGRTTEADGSFVFQPAQVPGTYRLTAQLLSENREATLEYASVPLTLTDADVDLLITMKPTVSVRGRLVFDGTPPVDLQPGVLSIVANAAARNLGPDMTIPRVPVSGDFEFTMRNLAGELVLRPAGSGPQGWGLKTVLLGSEDITDVPREFRAEDSGRIQIVMTNRWAELSGTVTDEKGQPARTGTVVLFSEDRAAWFAESSRMRAMPFRAGRFVMQGLRAGRYFVSALPPDTRWDFQDFDKTLLEKLAADAPLVTIGDEDRRQIDLRVTNR